MTRRIRFGTAMFVFAIAGCGGTAVRPPGGGGPGGSKDLTFFFPEEDLAGGGGGGDDGGGNPNEPNECGDFEQGCMSKKVGPAFNMQQPKFPLKSDQPADPNEKDDGLSRDANGYLALDQTKASSEFVYAANTGDWARGTVSKFSSKTVREVSRYVTTTCFSIKGGSRQPCDGKTGCCAADSWPQFQNRKGGMASGPYQQVSTTSNDPSRTAVDFDGSLWVSNRAFSGQSSVTKVAGDISACKDRNGNGRIDTSKDTNGDGLIQTDCNSNNMPDDLMDVANAKCTNGMPQEFFGLDDECLLFTTNTNMPMQYGRPLGLGPGANDFGPSDAWAGTYNDGKFFRIDGTTGITKDMVQLAQNCRPYGLVVDSAAIAWATNLGSGMCYFNTKKTTEVGVVRAATNGESGYGIALDRDQNIWVASSNAYRYTPDRKNGGFMGLGQGYWTAVMQPGQQNGGGYGLGIAVDTRNVKDYFVYIGGGSAVTQIPASKIPLPMGMDTTVNGAAFPAVKVAGSAKGVGVAADQNVFCISQGTPVVTRVKVDAMGVMTVPDIASAPMGNNKCPGGDRCEYKDSNASNPSPYTYSDFTGFGLKNFTRPKGSYSYVFEGCSDGKDHTETKWARVVWDGETPLNTTLSLRARAGSTPTPDNSWGPWSTEFNASPADLVGGMPLTIADKDAYYLQVEFQFATTDKVRTPKLKGFVVSWKCGIVPG